MTARRPTRERLLLVVFLALTAAQAFWATRRDASVADEHPHILSGWLYWQCGRFSGGLDNPPLGQLLLAAPLRLFHVSYRFPSDASLWLARLPVVVLLLATGLLLWRWGKTLGGLPVACAAALGLCFEPNLLAHGHLATLDLPLVFFWWAALWLWRRVLMEAPPAGSVAWSWTPGFALAVTLAMATKFTGVFLLPACTLVGFVVSRGRRTGWTRSAVILGCLVCFLLLSHLFYAFEPTRFGLPQHLVQAVQGKLAHREEGHFSYLAGRRSLSGFPEYEWVALLLKTPVPLLLLAVAGSILAWRRLHAVDRALLFLPALLLMLVVSLAGVHIGVRHVLPVVPGLLLLAALGIVELWRRGIASRVAVSALVLWWSLGVARVAPQYLAYFNELAGGPAGGHRYLLDSNLAWGQDDGRLRDFLQAASARGEAWEVNPPGQMARTGRLAVDVNSLHQLLRLDPTPYAWLRSFRPVGYAGMSWPLYVLHVEDFARRAAARRDDLQAQLSYAEVLAQDGEVESAQALFEGEARGEAVLPVAQRAAWLFLELRHFEKAGAWIERGLAVVSSDVELQRMQQRLQWERLEKTRTSADGALQLGLWWLQRGEKERALPWLVKAQERGVSSPHGAQALGRAFLQVGEFSRAVSAFEVFPGAATQELATARGWMQAETIFRESERRGVDLQRGDAAAWMAFATTLFRTRRDDEAVGVLMQVLRHEPDHAGALALLSEISVRSKLRVIAERLIPRAAPGVQRSEAP